MGTPRIIAVTTFNADGFEKYGQKMIRSFDRFWHCNVQLIVYVEGWSPKPTGNELYRDLHLSSEWLQPFKKRNLWRNQNIGYRHDAIRFAHKVAAVIHALEYDKPDYLIWVDGDTVAHSGFTDEDLKTLLPKPHEWITWLDRLRSYPECGFYIINCRHARHDEMLGRFRAMYENDELFRLHEWHDSFVLQQTVEQAGVLHGSLSGDTGRKTHHPFVNGPLGHWFDHLKGARKEGPRTPDSDLVAGPRSEPYWSNS